MELTENKLKQRVQRNILTVSVLILVGKFIAYYLTNSVGVLTDAMESIVNVVAGAISLFSLCLSEKPKDQNHPFGHGKIELISASIEGILISIAGGMIIYEGIKRLLVPTDIQKIDVGILCKDIRPADAVFSGYAAAGDQVVHPVEYLEKRRFSASGRSDKRRDLLFRYLDVYIVKCVVIPVPEIAVTRSDVCFSFRKSVCTVHFLSPIDFLSIFPSHAASRFSKPMTASSTTDVAAA